MEKKVVTFTIRDEIFGLFSDDVKEIVYPPRIFTVPKAPFYVRGVGNLRGNIIPIVDLKSFLFGEISEIGENTKLVVASRGEKDVGLIVEDLKEVLDIDEKEFQVSASNMSSHLQGVFKGKKSIIQFLNIETLFSSDEKSGFSKEMAEHKTKKTQDKLDSYETEGIVIFKIGDEEFGISIDDVKEIIDAPKEITEAPGTSPFIIGLFSLRGKVLPLISLSELLSLPKLEEFGRVIVVEVEGEIGICVSQAKEVLRISKELIEPPPASFTLEEREFIKGIVKLDQGERFVIYLDPKKLIPTEVKVLHEDLNEKKEEEQINMVEMRKFVNFCTGSVMMAFPIEKVVEVVDYVEAVFVPKAPFFVEGVINLRGEVLPVVSLVRKLDIKGSNQNQRIIVVTCQGSKIGFIVDVVKGIIRLDENLLFPPDGIPDFKEEFLDAVARLDSGELVLILNPDTLLSEEESEKIKKVTEVEVNE